MALGSLNTQAIALANNLIGIAQTLVAQKALIDTYSTQYTQLTFGTTFSAMTTINVGADGVPANANDATPTAGHPISPNAYPGIRRLVSANDIGSLLTLLQAVSSLLSGVAVTQQGQAPQLLAKLVGGENSGPMG